MSLEQQYTEILGQLGEDVSREGLLDTPKRAAKAMQYMCKGYQQTLEEVTNGALFSSDNSEMVLALGVAVVIEAQHMCMMMRGVEKQNSSMVTSVMLGEFRENAATRSEFLSLINN